MNDGRFQYGHTETREVKEKRIASCTESWKQRNDYISDIKHHYIYNAWRSMNFTLKGKSIGIDKSWNDYRTFYNDVFPTYVEGYRFQRIDKKDIFSPTNFIWIPDCSSALLKEKTILITYNNESLTFKEWANKLNVSYNGIRNRYFKNKNYSTEEILLGKKKRLSRAKLDSEKLPYQKLRDKASKMCSSYKQKDRKSRKDYDLDADWLIENILFKKCSYCGTDKYIGCDRIDNSKGHTKDNVIPCCHVCNTIRGDNFTVDEMKKLGKCVSEINKDRNK